MKFRSRRHRETATCPPVTSQVPAWATEDTQQVATIAQISSGVEWATESTGLLKAISYGLRHEATPR